MKHFSTHIAKPLYESVPFVYFGAGVAVLIIAENLLLTLFGIFLFCYCAYISFLRLMNRDSIQVNCTDEIEMNRKIKQVKAHVTVRWGISPQPLCQRF